MPNRFNVYFAAWGDWPEPGVMTSVMGREPDEFLAKGVIVGRAKVPRKRSVWRITSGLAETETIEQHLEALLERLERYSDGLRRAAGEHDVGINCAAYWHTSQPGFHLSDRLLARVTALGLSLDFDMYCLGDDEETGG